MNSTSAPNSESGQTKAVLFKQAYRFLIAGLLVQVVDYIAYRGFLLLVTYHYAKAGSFVLGGLTAFLLGKYFTFSGSELQKAEMWRFAALYATALGINVAMNSAALSILTTYNWLGLETFAIENVAYVVATGTSAAYNFLGQKFFVFRK